MGDAVSSKVGEHEGCVYGQVPLLDVREVTDRAVFVMDGSDSIADKGQWTDLFRRTVTYALAELQCGTMVECYMLGQEEPFETLSAGEIIDGLEGLLQNGACVAAAAQSRGSFLTNTVLALNRKARQVDGTLTVYVFSDGEFYDDLLSARPPETDRLELVAVDITARQGPVVPGRFLPRLFRYARIVSAQQLGDARPPAAAEYQVSLTWQGLDMIHLDLWLGGQLLPLACADQAAASIRVAAAQWHAADSAPMLVFRALAVEASWRIAGTAGMSGARASLPLEFAGTRANADLAAAVRRIPLSPATLCQGLWDAAQELFLADPARQDEGLDRRRESFRRVLRGGDAPLRMALIGLLGANWASALPVQLLSGSSCNLLTRRFVVEPPATSISIVKSRGRGQGAETMVISLGPGEGRIEADAPWLVAEPARFGQGQTKIRIRLKEDRLPAAGRCSTSLFFLLDDEATALRVKVERG